MVRRPDFFIVGAPKCGTTAMYEYLRQHPDTFMPARKEIRYFGSDLSWIDRSPRTEEQYLAFFDGARHEQRVGTAYVWYLYSKTAAQEICDFAPAADIIVMLRNPVDMLYALHSEHLFNGNEDVDDFGEALAAEEERRAGRRIPPHAHLIEGLLYHDVARYAEQLQRYFTVFGRDRVHVVIFDDFVADTAAVYRRTLEFLRLDTSFTPTLRRVNPNKRVRSAWLRRILNAPPEAPRRLIRAVVPAGVRRGAYRMVQRGNITHPDREALDPDLRRRLTAELAPEVGRLSELLGRDLSHWSRVA